MRCVREHRPPVVGGGDGKKALEVAVEILRQIHDGNAQGMRQAV